MSFAKLAVHSLLLAVLLPTFFVQGRLQGNQTRSLALGASSDVIFFHQALHDGFVKGKTWGYPSHDLVSGDLKGFAPKDFQSQRWGRGKFRYEIPLAGLLPNTPVLLSLGFAEVWKPTCKAGHRVFDVEVNGEEFVSDLDVYSRVGCGKALVIEKVVRVSGSKLKVLFRPIRLNPIISFIQVKPLTGPRIPLSDFRSIEGTENPLGGNAGDTLIRKSWAQYPDNKGDVIKAFPEYPNPRDISNIVHKQVESVVNERRLSDMMWAFGQLLDHDLSVTEANAVFGELDIPMRDPDDILYAAGSMHFDRAKFEQSTGTVPGNPREHVNELTAFIDASNVYGSDKTRFIALRKADTPYLKTSADGLLLPLNTEQLPNGGGNNTALFLAGDIRANEQVGLIAMHTLFVREHNRLAKKIADRYGSASTDQVFHLARKIIGAEMQIITYKEFLPVLLGYMAPNLDMYDGYDYSVNPSIAAEFSTAAYRIGHTMLSPSLLLHNGYHPIETIELRDAFFNVDFIKEDPSRVDYLIGGFAKQECQEIDHLIVENVRSFLFDKNTPFIGGFDLPSLNIQRGRDMGIPSYNAVRLAYGLTTAKSYADITQDTSLQAKLEEAFGEGNVDMLDLWTAALCEDLVPGASVGETIATIIAEQFQRLMDGDPFFYLGDDDLSGPELKKIINLDTFRLADVIRENTDIRNLSSDVFHV